MIRRFLNYGELEKRLPVFGTEAFLRSRSSDYGWLGNDEYVVPYIVDRKLIFKRLIFTSEPVQLGRANNSYGPFLDEVIKYIKDSIQVDFIAKPQSNVVLMSYPENSEHAEWGSYRLELDSFRNDDELMEIIHQKHRNVIRKAVKDGVEVKEATSIEEVYCCIRETFERQRELLYPSDKYLRDIKNNLQGQLLLYKAEWQGQLQGVAVVPYNHMGGYYYFGGSCARPHPGSLNLLQYQIIKLLKERGVRLYDFMGARIHVEENSKFEGIQRFRSRFGGKLVQGHTFRMILKPVKHLLFDAAVRAYYKLNRADYQGDLMDQEKSRKLRVG